MSEASVSAETGFMPERASTRTRSPGLTGAGRTRM